MANITENDIRLIAENNLRSAGLSGQYENGWKKTIDSTSGPITQTFGLQELRDVIAKTVVDSLQNNIVAGTLSEGNTQGVPVVVNQSTDTVINSDPDNTGDRVLINPSEAYIFLSNPLAEPPKAARQGDGTVINFLSDPTFTSIYSALIATVYALDLTGTFKNIIDNQYGGPPSPTQIVVSGVITGGSDTVRIGESNGYV